MDSDQGPCETQVGGGVARQVSQTNNQLEETVVMPEQLEKKNMDMDDLNSQEPFGKVHPKPTIKVPIEQGSASKIEPLRKWR